MSYKNPIRKHSCRLSTPVRLGVAAVTACFLATPLLAAPPVPSTNLPTGFTNLVGIDAKNIVYGANSLDILTSANRSAADVDKFNIAAGYRVSITQPTVSANVLFRVLSNDPSVIYGRLSSNGGVYLVNPGGIFVGPGGQVDVARFAASTLNITNADFLAGRNLFVNEGTAKDVINQGQITTPAGGSVYLIGSNVSNEGIITTPQGETILAAGNTVSLIDSALPGVKVDITGAAGNSTNLGTITAEAGRIGIAGVIVRNSGTLNASSIVNEGGRIFLKASQDTYVDGNGRIVTTGTRGGSVEVLGNRVAVMDNASIDASGASGGGNIKVGGDYRGRNPDIRNASVTYFGPNATLNADATGAGDGGTVIVWADDTTRAYGSISARGGVGGGNGGFVETSGHRYLDVTRAADVSAVSGLGGTWLLDPSGLKIINTGSDTNITGASPFTAGIGVSTLSASTINTGLVAGNVSIISYVGDDITFDAAYSGPIVITNGAGSGRVLSLSAGNDILFSGGSTTFQTTAPNSPLTVNFNQATSRKVEVQSGATLTFTGFNPSSAVTGVIISAAGTKTWENYGTINLSGESIIDLHDGTYYSNFNNNSGGVLNIASSAQWSFLSESGNQNGPLNNAGIINVNAPTSWEARYSQTSSGVLNVNGGLSMQHLDSVAGVVNINAGTLLLPEAHTGLNKFDGATINGPGTLQVGKAVGSATTVVFNNVSTTGGLKVLREEYGTLSFSGSNFFANTSFFANGTTNLDWVIPAATYSGTTQWWAKGNIGFANNVTFGGPVTLGAGWNANIATPDVVGPSAGSIQIIDKQILSSGDMTLKSGSDILIKRNLSGSTRVESAGVLAVEAWGDLILVNQFDPGGSVELKSAGNQTIQLKGALSDLFVQASAGGAGGGFTSLSSGGTQTINFAAGTHTLVVTGGMVGTTSASGAMASVESTGAQSILNSGTLAINLTGGNVALNNQSSYEDYGLPSQRLICSTCATHNSAQIRSKSSQNIAATTITIIGGSAGNGNHASIDAKGASTIVASGAVSITGGSSGGLYVGGAHDDYIANDAGIGADGALNLTAASILVAGGGAAYGGAYVGGGSSITVNTSGNLTLNGGTTAAQGAALTYANASPATMKWLAPAVIGSDAGSLTNITLNVGGNLTLNGGLMGQDGGSAAMIGGVKGTPVNLTILSQGDVNLTSANAMSSRIGSHAGGTIQIRSGMGGVGNMVLDKGLIGTGSGTGGSVQLYSMGSGSGATQNAGGMIFTDWLSVTASLTGPINLASFENRVGNVNATTTNQTITFNGQSVGLGIINSGTGSSTISALYDIHDNNGLAANITAGSVSLYSTNGGTAGSLAISADTVTAGNIVGSVSGGASGGIYVRNSGGTPTSVILSDSASANTSAKFYNDTSYATSPYSLTALNGGTVGFLSGGDLNYNGATFNTGGNGKIGMVAVGTLAITSFLGGGNNSIALGGATINVNSTITTTGDLAMGGGVINISNGFVTAQNVVVGAGTLNIGNGVGGSGGITANNHLLAVVTGDVNILGDSWGPSYIHTVAGDLEMLVGGNLKLTGYNATNDANIWAGYTKLSPYFPDASIAVGGDVKLNNGGHIYAANDVYLDLLGGNSKLVMNDGTPGYAPSYVLPDIGTGIAATTHVAFATRTAGGIIIDGFETTKTVVGGSGFFAVNSSTPATPGAGLDITYASPGTSDLCAISPALCKGPDTDPNPPPPPTKPDPDKKASCTEGTFGCDEEKKDKQDQAKDEKKDDKAAAKKIVQCGGF